jgi:protein subunit release factor A
MNKMCHEIKSVVFSFQECESLCSKLDGEAEVEEAKRVKDAETAKQMIDIIGKEAAKRVNDAETAKQMMDKRVKDAETAKQMMDKRVNDAETAKKLVDELKQLFRDGGEKDE